MDGMGEKKGDEDGGAERESPSPRGSLYSNAIKNTPQFLAFILSAPRAGGLNGSDVGCEDFRKNINGGVGVLSKPLTRPGRRKETKERFYSYESVACTLQPRPPVTPWLGA